MDRTLCSDRDGLFAFGAGVLATCDENNKWAARRGGGMGIARIKSEAAWLCACALLAIALTVGAQPAARIYRVGYLAMGTSAAGGDPRPLEAFKQALSDKGWVEGSNLVIEYRFAEGRVDRLDGLADELVRRQVDVIAASPTPAAVAARKATQTIPIVGMGLVEPVTLGLAASLTRPGGNITGITYGAGSEIYGKQLELLKRAAPHVRRVALLVNPGSTPSLPLIIDSVKTAAGALSLQLQIFEARRPEDFDVAFAAMAAQKVGTLLVIGDSMFFLHRARLGDLALKHKLPAMSTQAQWAEAGGLMAYGPSIPALWRRGAVYVDKILRGAQPQQLPIEQPTQFEMIINLKTADALGLAIPQPLLLSADQLIR